MRGHPGNEREVEGREEERMGEESGGDEGRRGGTFQHTSLSVPKCPQMHESLSPYKTQIAHTVCTLRTYTTGHISNSFYINSLHNDTSTYPNVLC